MLTLQDAKNRFSAVVEAALAGRPQEVSRRGKPAVVVISAEDYHRLVEAAQALARDAVVVTGNVADFAPTCARRHGTRDAHCPFRRPAGFPIFPATVPLIEWRPETWTNTPLAALV